MLRRRRGNTSTLPICRIWNMRSTCPAQRDSSHDPIPCLPPRSTFGVASVAPPPSYPFKQHFLLPCLTACVHSHKGAPAPLGSTLILYRKQKTVLASLAGFSGVLSPLAVPTSDTNVCRQKSRIFARCCIVRRFHSLPCAKYRGYLF